MTSKRKRQIRELLKGIETGDPDSVVVVNQDKYIQHNPQTHEGGEGLAALFKRLSQSNPRVNIVRIFSDGDYVFGHTEYDFDTSRVGFEIFRFEGARTVEHWDNIQLRKGPNESGRSMVDGPTEATDLNKTEANRELVRQFVSEVLIENRYDKLDTFVDQDFVEHNPRMSDGIESLRAVLLNSESDRVAAFSYDKQHHLLAEGNFVLSVCEGFANGDHTAFFDLFRIADHKIAEHWDTTEKVPPRSEWKNDNGKF